MSVLSSNFAFFTGEWEILAKSGESAEHRDKVDDWNELKKQLMEMPLLAPNPEEAFSEELFKSQGGYQRLKKDLGDVIDQIVYTINDNLYKLNRLESVVDDFVSN